MRRRAMRARAWRPSRSPAGPSPAQNGGVPGARGTFLAAICTRSCIKACQAAHFHSLSVRCFDYSAFVAPVVFSVALCSASRHTCNAASVRADSRTTASPNMFTPANRVHLPCAFPLDQVTISAGTTSAGGTPRSVLPIWTRWLRMVSSWIDTVRTTAWLLSAFRSDNLATRI